MRDRDIKFFRPLWRRVAVVLVCAAWALLELRGGDQLWIAITLGLTAYAVWQFFIGFPKPAAPEGSKGGDDAPPQA